jgi:hypothetical protein
MPSGVMPVSLLTWFLVYHYRVAPLRVLGSPLILPTPDNWSHEETDDPLSPTVAKLTHKSDDDVVQFAFRWVGLVGSQRRVVAIERRAIGAHILNILAHVAEDMRMVLWRQRTYAHECLGADLDDRHAGLVMEMRNDYIRHGLHNLHTFCRDCHFGGRPRESPGLGRPGLNGQKAG